MRTTQSLISKLRLVRQCLLLGFLLTPVMAVGQDSDFQDTLRSAEEGDAVSQAMLGFIYEIGEGVPQNYAEAVKWYRLAADQGFAEAQYNLALMYDNGEGVPSNNVTAYVWFNIAAASGFEDAIKNRSVIEKRMTSSQIAEGQQLSTEIFERIQQGN